MEVRRVHKNFKISEEVETALKDLQMLYKEDMKASAPLMTKVSLSQNTLIETIIMEKWHERVNSDATDNKAGIKQKEKSLVEKYK